MSTIGQSLIAGLAARGVEVVFGIPGVHTIELYRGLDGSGIRHVTARHEQAAGFMADGYARVSGRPGVALVITGPGVTNILTAMAQARADSVPMLVISSVNARGTLGRGLGYLHELPDQRALVSQVALRTERIEGHAAVGPALDRAFSAMLSGRPGPVHLEVPLDVMGQRAEESGPAALLQPVRAPAARALDEAAARLSAARCPVILAGGGARLAETALCAIAEALDAPVVLTANSRGMMHGHPLCVPASPSLEAVRSLIKGADQILAAGTEIGPTDYDMYARGGMPDLSEMIRIDIDRIQLARRPAALTLMGDAGAVLHALTLRLEPRGGGSGATRAEAARKGALEEIGAAMRAQVAVLEAVRAARPGSVIVGDSTAPVYAGNLCYDHDRPGGWFNSATGYGALGYATGAAVGAALAEAGKRVICLLGDGGLQFSPGELMTAVDEELPITFVVWNNRGFGEIALAMREAGTTVIGCDPQPPDLALLAASCGLEFASVMPEPEAVARAVRDATRGPAMVEIVAG